MKSGWKKCEPVLVGQRKLTLCFCTTLSCCGINGHLAVVPLIVFQSIFISRVTEEGPAGQAGITVGDKLLAVSTLLLIFERKIVNIFLSISFNPFRTIEISHKV